MIRTLSIFPSRRAAASSVHATHARGVALTDRIRGGYDLRGTVDKPASLTMKGLAQRSHNDRAVWRARGGSGVIASESRERAAFSRRKSGSYHDQEQHRASAPDGAIVVTALGKTFH